MASSFHGKSACNDRSNLAGKIFCESKLAKVRYISYRIMSDPLTSYPISQRLFLGGIPPNHSQNHQILMLACFNLSDKSIVMHSS